MLVTLGTLLVGSRQSGICSNTGCHSGRLLNVGDQLMLEHQRSGCKLRVRTVSACKQQLSILLILSRIEHVVAGLALVLDHFSSSRYLVLSDHSPLETKSRRHFGSVLFHTLSCRLLCVFQSPVKMVFCSSMANSKCAHESILPVSNPPPSDYKYSDWEVWDTTVQEQGRVTLRHAP